MLRNTRWVLVALATFSLGLSGASTKRQQQQSSSAAGDGGPATKAELNGPTSISIARSGDLYIVEMEGNRVRQVVAKTGRIRTIAGNGIECFGIECNYTDNVPAALVTLNPISVAVDANGDVFVSDISGRIRRIDKSTGLIRTVAGGGSTRQFLGEISALQANLEGPESLVFDSAGNLYFSDTYRHRVYRLDSVTSTLKVIAGREFSGFSGDGGLASQAQLRFPMGLAFDSEGNLFIADYENCRIRMIDAHTGNITTVAGTGKQESSGDGGPATHAALNFPDGIAVDRAGNIYFVEGATDRIRRIDRRTGIITTAIGTGVKGFGGDGGPADSAELNNPSDVAIDSEGNIYVSEYMNNRVRRVDAATGLIRTVAGNGLPRRVEGIY